MTKMVSLYFALLAIGSTSVWGLQVTPNSPCASVCLNNPSQDPSDPNVSNTFGSEIVCQDDDYTFNPIGQKFETCLNCLQNSTASASGESDQAWFLYNLRFAFNACIFGATNATDPLTIPCSLDTACGPIQGAMMDGMDDPATLQQYSYCSAYDNSFLGSFLGTCGKCLTETAEEFMFSNFLIALHAGCLQQPKQGDILGLNSTVFTLDQIEITSPKVPTYPTSHKVMTIGVIIGIAIAGLVVILIILAILFVCSKKRRNARRLHQLHSPLDSRFGAKNITAPNKGAFSSPRNSPLLAKKESLPMKRTPRPLNFSRQSRTKKTLDDLHEQPGERTPLTASDPPSYTPPNSGLFGRESPPPMHAAYIPHEFTSSSRNSIQEIHRASLSPQFRHSLTPDILPPPLPQPPPATHPQHPASITATAKRTSSATPEPMVMRNPSNASRYNRFHTRDPSSGAMGRARDPSVGSTRRTRDASVGRSRDASVGRRARDTSVGSMGRVREGSRDRGNIARIREGSRDRGGTPVSISGPIIKVGNRFENEEQARKARETLYLRGLGSTISHHPHSKEIDDESPESVRSAHSEEMWPGNY